MANERNLGRKRAAVAQPLAKNSALISKFAKRIVFLNVYADEHLHLHLISADAQI